MWEIILILTVFTILPVRIEFQLIAALLMSYLSLVCWHLSGHVSFLDPQTLSYVMGYLVAVFFGYLISWQINRIRRTQYQNYMDELTLRKELESALAEVKELQGLIPICANCKSVRDDNGYWSTVESYVSDHSKATFSHSVCPKCAQELYPDLDMKEITF